MSARLVSIATGFIVAAVLVVAGAIARHYHGAARYQAGYQQANSENAKALAEWQQHFDAQVKSDEERLTNAHRQHELEVAQLAAHRAQPARRVVCEPAPGSPGDLPAAARLSTPDASGAGTLPGPARPRFDPTDELYRLADDADDILAHCRELNDAVHGVPDAP